MGMRRYFPCCWLCHTDRSPKGIGDREKTCFPFCFLYFFCSHFFQCNCSPALAVRCTCTHEPTCNNVGVTNVTCNFCGALHWMKEKVVVSSLTRPHFPTCCWDGFVHLLFLPDLPPFLHTFRNTQLSVHGISTKHMAVQHGPRLHFTWCYRRLF
jgi:hypothetical protein